MADIEDLGKITSPRNIKYEFSQCVYNTFITKISGLNEDELKNKKILMSILRKSTQGACKTFKGLKMDNIPSNDDIRTWYQNALMTGSIQSNPYYECVIMFNHARSGSGVTTVTLMLDGRDGAITCKSDCHYCPNEPGVARSYLSNEGVPILGETTGYGIYQVWHRLAVLEAQGHNIDKMEIILLGGTWHSLSRDYRNGFIHMVYYACNVYTMLSMKYSGTFYNIIKEWLPHKYTKKLSDTNLEEQIKAIRPMGTFSYEKTSNSSGTYGRIISIVIETRPDECDSYENLMELRWLGVTRVQIGMQSLSDHVLKTVGRGHTIEDTKIAVKNLLNAGFKIDRHWMPDLPGSTVEDDIFMACEIFRSEDLQGDQDKYYSTMILPFTKIKEWYDRAMTMISSGQIEKVHVLAHKMTKQQVPDSEKVWLPRSEFAKEKLDELHTMLLANVLPWVRVNRLLRDFQKGTEKNGYLGFTNSFYTNYREECDKTNKKNGILCLDIRAREVGGNPPTNYENRIRLYIRRYRASQGWEYFISIEVPECETNPDDAVLFGLIRLRIPDEYTSGIRLPELASTGTGIIRELHVYGNSVNVIDSTGIAVQHKGVGKFLLWVAEAVAGTLGCEKIAIISGVGVMDYYAKNGYHRGSVDAGDYMIKQLSFPLPLQENKIMNVVYKLYDIVDAVINREKSNKIECFKDYGNMAPNATLMRIGAYRDQGSALDPCN
jgi:histone acetyltransferase (RNA polymerase elongator complex component)